MVIKLQGLTRGFLARNAFYQNMIDKNYTPGCEDMRKRLIGFKLGLISKRQSNIIRKQREEAGLMVNTVDNNIKNTEKLLESFYPNVQRLMNQKNLREANSFKRKQ